MERNKKKLAMAGFINVPTVVFTLGQKEKVNSVFILELAACGEGVYNINSIGKVLQQ